MANLMRLDTTIVNGIINLGKYTFPKIVAFFVNTLDALVKHSEK